MAAIIDKTGLNRGQQKAVEFLKWTYGVNSSVWCSRKGENSMNFDSSSGVLNFYKWNSFLTERRNTENIVVKKLHKRQDFKLVVLLVVVVYIERLL